MVPAVVVPVTLPLGRDAGALPKRTDRTCKVVPPTRALSAALNSCTHTREEKIWVYHTRSLEFILQQNVEIERGTFSPACELLLTLIPTNSHSVLSMLEALESHIYELGAKNVSAQISNFQSFSKSPWIQKQQKHISCTVHTFSQSKENWKLFWWLMVRSIFINHFVTSTRKKR